jgi:hypothetical protein
MTLTAPSSVAARRISATAPSTSSIEMIAFILSRVGSYEQKSCSQLLNARRTAVAWPGSLVRGGPRAIVAKSTAESIPSRSMARSWPGASTQVPPGAR